MAFVEITLGCTEHPSSDFQQLGTESTVIINYFAAPHVAAAYMIIQYV